MGFGPQADAVSASAEAATSSMGLMLRRSSPLGAEGDWRLRKTRVKSR
jgi:hypothetical protein